jgi:hypothetical protein
MGVHQVMTSRIVSLLAAAGLCLAGASALAAINSSYDGGGLYVTTMAGEDVIVTTAGGLVKVNGADPESGGVPFTVPVAGLGYAVVTGDDLPQTLDVSGLSTASGLASGSGFSLSGGGGDDVLIGAGLSTYFDGGPGADSCLGGSTNDTYRIQSGEGPDTMATFGGRSYLYVVGDATDEIYRLYRDGEDLVITSGAVEVEHLRLTGGIWIMTLALYGGDDTVTTGDLTGFGIENMALLPEEGKFHLESSSSGIFNQLNMDATAGDSIITCGNCQLYYSADDAGETATLTASGTAAVLNRISPRPATISLTGVGTVSLSGGAGDDHLTVGNLESTATGVTIYQGRGGTNLLLGEEYTGYLQLVTGLTPGSTEAHLPPSGLTDCAHWAQDAAGSSLVLDANGPTGRIVDVGLGVVPLTITGGAAYLLSMGTGDDAVEVENLASASIRSIQIGFQAGDDSLILRDLGSEPGFTVTADGEMHVGGDSLTLDASGMPYNHHEPSGIFEVGSASVSYRNFESVAVINAPTPTPSPSPSPSPTASLTPSLTASPSPSPTASATASPSPSPSPSPSSSPTPSPSLSPTPAPGPAWVVE